MTYKVREEIGWLVAESSEPLVPTHGGYRNLKSFQVAQLAFDLTVRFSDKFVSKRSRTHDQMVQAARSGVQNIAEGSQASGTSKKMEIKLTNVARASLEELLLDYEDFLRQRNLAQRCRNVDEIALWAIEIRNGPDGRNRADGPSYEEIAANAAHVLVGVACALLDRQISRLAKDFETEGGFTERLYRTRTQRRRRSP